MRGGFTSLRITAPSVVRLAQERSLEVQFEVGKKQSGLSDHVVDRLIAQGRRWLDAGAVQLVVKARETAAGVVPLDAGGDFDRAHADRFVHAFGLQAVMFEASQFALLDHFGKDVHLSNVRLEELLRVEIYRRGLHLDAFCKENLRPPPMEKSTPSRN
jgi:phosphosulfolactate synthase